jgi:hypothetical protein
MIVEILANAIRKNPHIEGIRMNGGEFQIIH